MGPVFMNSWGNRRTSFPSLSFGTVRHVCGWVGEKIPVKFGVYLVLSKLELRTIVREDRAWCAVIPREEFFVAFNPTKFRFFNRVRIGPVTAVTLEEQGHAQHVARDCGMAVFPASFTRGFEFRGPRLSCAGVGGGPFRP